MQLDWKQHAAFLYGTRIWSTKLIRVLHANSSYLDEEIVSDDAWTYLSSNDERRPYAFCYFL